MAESKPAPRLKLLISVIRLDADRSLTKILRKKTWCFRNNEPKDPRSSVKGMRIARHYLPRRNLGDTHADPRDHCSTFHFQPCCATP